MVETNEGCELPHKWEDLQTGDSTSHRELNGHVDPEDKTGGLPRVFEEENGQMDDKYITD